MVYVDVVFNLKIDKSFSYKIPPDISTEIEPGRRVLAPFGKQELTGIVVNISDKKPNIKCKEIIDILDDHSLIQEDLLQLTDWMSKYYLSSWGTTLQIALPKGLEKKSNVIVDILDKNDLIVQNLTEKQRYLYDLIYNDPGKTVIYYKSKFGTGSFDYTLRVLEGNQLIKKSKQIANERVRKKLIRYLTVSEKLQVSLSGLRDKDTLLSILSPYVHKKIPVTEFKERTGLSAGRIRTLIKRGILNLSESEVFRLYDQRYEESPQKIILNEAQKRVLNSIYEALNPISFKVFLLHGVTGSGKTQIYIEAIQKVLENNKSAIVLIPEISLTPQTVGRFKRNFKDSVYVFHSRMGLGERYDTWRKVQQSERCIVVGPRSALFLPVKNLGIIVVDEEHDGSFKQVTPAPRYHARDTAIYRAKINDAIVLLGSATPSLESYYNAIRGKYQLLKLENRIDNLELPYVQIINMNKHERGPKHKSIFSQELIQDISTCLENKQQTILLQNRRGFAAFLQCKTCGHSNKCPDCDIYLTYHATSQNLQCHYCGYATSATNTCPKCGGIQIRYIGAGTQQIESELRKIFPDVKILRMDVDTTTKKNAHETILNRFKDQKADILLGTQMIAKGLDFENVYLVGVISADIGLTLPDFRSSENIFQLLTQVAGRAGRKIKRGKVIIQTGMENHYAIQFAKRHDFEGFYHQESAFRREASYPPFTRLINIGISSDNHKKVNIISKEIAKRLKNYSYDFYSVIGPAPAPMIRLKNKYRWQILLKIDSHKDPSGKRIRTLLKNALDTEFLNKIGAKTIVIDVDPIDML